MRLIFFLIFVYYATLCASQNPSIKVLDTDFSKGRLKNVQTLSLSDVVKLHGHLCDGLVFGFLGLRETLYLLYNDSIINRTDTRIVSRSSPCLADIAIYLTGARFQYNSFYVSDSIKYQFIVQRMDDSIAYGVKLKDGIMPQAIDSLSKLASKGELDACGIDSLRSLEDKFSSFLLSQNPRELFVIEEVENFRWLPFLKNDFRKTDVVNKKSRECAPK